MKKTLLLFSLLFLTFSSYSQGTCATAFNITTNGDYTTGSVSGTHPGAGNGWCWGTNSSTPNALWYSFTPSTNGILTVSSAI
ncbi:MAG: hypothetical protein KBC58_11060, partial [Flavobacterium sp.]|nr:hypothetical protein [Flavobacterium sp.]